ncbi:hypothetical protein LN040_03885 [Desulfovibrio subterraneus]|uniref:Uncharacterized protein n=1 Tax=Desulfovibrio subterraneus TaxID=2718620 RepID=A0A7J0BK86_9BACT|nr:hypothetical protein [Desulfovibrio subterraneus]WBF68254.1 hypothetical protein LN040_03885 [Desulfovibrio subterraneus]GFM34203.1 hypothetical protein DSM101010T_25680 [Desulfovibrio subterraneus]
MERNPLARMTMLVHRWLPGRAVDAQSMAEAVLLEKDYWEKMAVAVTNGVAKAFNG